MIIEVFRGRGAKHHRDDIDEPRSQPEMSLQTECANRIRRVQRGNVE